MQSHTVPRKLLDQFAYDDPVTRSRRLWRYQKGRHPYGNASPRTATRFEGHFSDPRDPDKELELENRLTREIEDPVNAFIEIVAYRTFVLTSDHIRKLTRYITLLFNRSRARLGATQHQLDIMIGSMNALLSNDEQLEIIAAKLTVEGAERGYALTRPLTKEDVAKVLRRNIEGQNTESQLQHNYARSVEVMLSGVDQNLLYGHWDILRTEPDEPFAIGDAPVVTWERTERNMLMFGQGFARPNVEVLLPVSPTSCLRVLPAVQRTRPVMPPATVEVNMAEASFATQYCFTNINSPKLDETLQRYFGQTILGLNAFTLRHRDFTNTMFNILMNRSRWVEPPLKQ
jgi:hypothetical protein